MTNVSCAFGYFILIFLKIVVIFKKYFYTGVRYNAFALQAGFNLKDERNHCDRSEVMTSVTKLRHRGKYNLRNRGSIH